VAPGSNYLFQGQTLTASGTYTATLSTVNGCDSIIRLQLLVAREQRDTVTGCGSIIFQGQVYQQSGIVRDTVRSAGGCDSLIRITYLQVLPVPAPTELQQCVAPGGSYLFQGTTLTASGTYTAVLSTVNGCDSLVRLRLLVARRDTVTLQGCSSVSYGGQTYSANTELQDTVRATGGCDSLIRTVLIQVGGVATNFLTVCLQPGQTYAFNGQVLTGSGVYTAVFTTAGGCDSTVSLNLLIAAQRDTTISACGSYTYRGVVYTASTVINDTLVSISTGCDSLYLRLELTITLGPRQFLTACAGVGGNYTFNGQTLTGSGTYTAVFPGTGGCDSTVQLYLVVAALQTNVLSGCDSVLHNGTWYTNSTVLRDTVASQLTACDSVIRETRIVVNRSSSSFATACIAAGQVYPFHGQSLTATGLYGATLVNSAGCDSLLTLYLTVTERTEQTFTGCNTIVFNGTTYTTSATLRDTVRSLISGCDSLIRVVHLQIGSGVVTRQTVCLPPGGTYVFGGQPLTASGQYSVTLTAEQGCDSLVVLTLLVTRREPLILRGCDSVVFNGIRFLSDAQFVDTVQSVLTGCDSLYRDVAIHIDRPVRSTLTVCLSPGDTYLFNGQQLTQSGQYEASFARPGQCDSTVQLVLQIPVVRRDTLSGCTPITYNGQVYTASSLVRDTIRAVISGCDSIYHYVQILIGAGVQSYATQCIDAGQMVLFNGQQLTASGAYSALIVRPGQCDSTANLYLVVKQTIVEQFTGCDALTYNGTIYTQSTVLRDTVRSLVSGCDSLVRNVVITVDPSPSSYQLVCLPQGGSLTFNGQLIAAGGYYQAQIARPGRCDSTANLYLTVTQRVEQTITGCGTVTFNGVQYSASTILRDTVRSLVTQCDSLLRETRIVVNEIRQTFLEVCRPPGSSYVFGGMVLTSSGSYRDTLTAASGCDSIVRLHLVITHRRDTTLSGCGLVLYNGVRYTASTVLQQTIPSSLTGCDSLVERVEIQVNPRPGITVSPSTARVCAGDSIRLMAQSSGNALAWVGGPATGTYWVSPQAETTYYVVATAPSGCTDTASIRVTVNRFNLELEATPNPVVAGTPIRISAVAAEPFQVLRWAPAALFPVNRNPQQVIADTGFTVVAIGRSAEGCIDTASLQVIVDPLGDLYLPTAFTPNGDGRNDLFRLLGGDVAEMELRIFNRWGEVVFTTRNRSIGWDGTVGGKPQPTGAFVYTLQATLRSGARISRKGTVMLVR
jgi:gliding motility-associated-like protein